MGIFWTKLYTVNSLSSKLGHKVYIFNRLEQTSKLETFTDDRYEIGVYRQINIMQKIKTGFLNDNIWW